MRLKISRKGGNALLHDRLAGLAVLAFLILGSVNMSGQLEVYTSRTAWEAEMANIVNEGLESLSGQIIDLKTTPTTVGTHHFAGSGSNGGVQTSSFPGGLMVNTTRIEMGGTTGGTPKTTVTIPASFGIAFDWKTSAPSPNGAHNSLYLRVNGTSGSLTKLLNQSSTEGFIGIISPCGGITAYEIYTTLANFQSFNMDNFSYGDLAGGLPDADNDGTPDCTDGCPNDPDKIAPGACGCGVVDVDNDNDGYYACDDDCDDNNSAIHPGADEICDGIDNDCDGLVDTDDPDYVPGPLPDITCQDITVTFAGEA
ncbi:MAG TPA: putative metal-binding motif-containing protein, partial [Flavilitoribacter sp.]|nr:putative metal-binding motif-containing protein [Flavilitoribacter sp.]